MALIDYQNDSSFEEEDLSLSLLEMSLKHGIPHMHVCGGTARCSTCRVMILENPQNVLPPNGLEKKLSLVKGFEPNIRLACQAHVTGPVKIRRLALDDEDAELAIEIPTATTGRETRLAILFSDIRDFTVFSERHLSYDTIHILNRYFYQMGEAILKNEGYIDKYMGDGIMALFGIANNDPVANCHNAVTAALQMLDELKNLNKYLKRVFDVEFRIGIGIHFGEAILGELGHPDRRQITVIGDSVNMASRIESSTKQYHIPLLISEDVRYQLRDRIEVGRAVDAQLKGKSGSYKLHEVLDLHEQTIIVDRETALRRRLNQALNEVITQQKAPLFLRAAFHDAGKHNRKLNKWGADGSLRFPEALGRNEHRGLAAAIEILTSIKDKFSEISWADLIALGGAVAVFRAGGPDIIVPLGRRDAEAFDPQTCVDFENLDIPTLKQKFEAMGLNVQEFVALSGAHTIGRNVGVPMTDDWFRFNNSYFRVLVSGGDCLKNFLTTDKNLMLDPETAEHVKRYAADQDAFFHDFAAAYKKMTLLGTGLDDSATARN